MRAEIIIGDSRSMKEVASQAIDLVVTSPPYWHIKDYGVPGQIGTGQSLHGYLKSLYCVWKECHRVLRDGGRLCVNIGDQFARSAIYGRYRVIPIHAEVIAQCEMMGFDFMGSIIWQKKTTMRTTGGANVMGSYPYPPNGIVELDYEFIHIFKKPGKPKQVSKEIRQASALSKAEWKQFFSGHWHFGGARQIEHEAMFPDELPRRLIRMFSFIGDTVLDPFLGSGTTAKVALEHGRSAVGYEINERSLQVIRRKLGLDRKLVRGLDWLDVIKRPGRARVSAAAGYTPAIQDARPGEREADSGRRAEPEHKVVEITDRCTVRLDTGLEVTFLGVRVRQKARALSYLRRYLLGKKVLLRWDCEAADGGGPHHRPAATPVGAYVFLKNRIFVNTHLLRAGLASPDPRVQHRLKNKFLAVAGEAQALARRHGQGRSYLSGS
ncbi:MAG TPA: site-specific DNA-methyltransferase [bacterium]|nr:site-specific DNA-methyltransferase [bacterium]